jgi:PHD-finger
VNSLTLSPTQCERLYHLSCLTPPLAEIPLGEWFCDDCLSHGQPDYLSQPAVYKETPAPGRKMSVWTKKTKKIGGC